jgi:hypothetical protein
MFVNRILRGKSKFLARAHIGRRSENKSQTPPLLDVNIDRVVEDAKARHAAAERKSAETPDKRYFIDGLLQMEERMRRGERK